MRTLLTNGVLIDGTARAPVADTHLVIDGEVIRDVHSGARPAGRFDEVIDLEGRFVLPGLIELHGHLCWDGSADPVATNDREGPEVTLVRMVRHARETLLAGITTFRDLGCVEDLSLVLERTIRLGLVPGPRLFACGKTIVMTGGHDPFWGIFCDGPQACVAAVRGQVSKGARLIKVSATGGVYGRTEGEEVGQSELTLEELRAICDEAHRLHRRVASHALGERGVEHSVEAGCDTIEHGIFGGQGVLRRMAREGRFLTPTLAIYRMIAEGSGPEYAKVKAQACVARHRETFTMARALGVSIAAGSDTGSPGMPHPALFDELDEMAAQGMPPLEVLQAATQTNARALGVEATLGTAEPGKLADLLIVEKNPAEAIAALRAPWGVMQGGRIVRQGARVFV